VGFNAKHPGRIKRADLIMLGSAVIVLLALVLWAVRG
jgi:hypothetical protein